MELSQVQSILFRTDLIELLGVVPWYVYFRPPLLLQFILHGTYNRLLSSLSLHYRHYFPSTFLLLVGSCLSSSTWHPTCTKRRLHTIYPKIKWKTTFRRLSFSRNQLMSFIVIFYHPHSTGRRSVCISSPILPFIVHISIPCQRHTQQLLGPPLSSGRDISALIRCHPTQGFNDKRTVKYMSHSSSYYYSYRQNPSQSNPLPIDMRFYFVSPRILPIKPTGWNLCRIRIPVIKWSIIHHARE